MSEFRPQSGDVFIETDDGLTQSDPYDSFKAVCTSDEGSTTKRFVPNSHDDNDENPKSFFSADNLFFAAFNQHRIYQVAVAEYVIESRRDQESGAATFHRDVRPLIKRDWQKRPVAYPGFTCDLFHFIENYKPWRFISAQEWERIKTETAEQRKLDREISEQQKAWHNAELARLEQGRKERANPTGELGKAIAQGIAVALPAALASMGIEPKKSKAAQ